MPTDQELKTLIDQARQHGAKIAYNLDANGHYASIACVGVPGCGPLAMAPIAAAERLREFVATHEAARCAVGREAP